MNVQLELVEYTAGDKFCLENREITLTCQIVVQCSYCNYIIINGGSDYRIWWDLSAHTLAIEVLKTAKNCHTGKNHTSLDLNPWLYPSPKHDHNTVWSDEPFHVHILVFKTMLYLKLTRQIGFWAWNPVSDSVDLTFSFACEMRSIIYRCVAHFFPSWDNHHLHPRNEWQKHY